MELFDKIKEATAYIQKKNNIKSSTHGIILGTGLGGFSRYIKNKKTIFFEDIPHFCKSKTISHTGQLVMGKIKNKSVIAMEGRLHFYEGFTMEEVTFPIRVMHALGVRTLYISNACGGINPQYSLGQIMFIEDHINLMGVNPLVGKNDERLGPRFPDMAAPYSQEHINKGREIALKNGIQTQKGVYVAVAGPNLETRAEYRYLKIIGADVVGMSTVPEVIVAVHAGIKVVGLSIVTDICLPDALKPVSIPEILSVAGKSTPQLNIIVKAMIENLN